jgi:hypothetical protein
MEKLVNLVKIQNELKVPKQNVNAFGKYKYRSAEDILEAVKPILLKYGTTLTLSDEIVAIGNKVFLKATASIWIDDVDQITYGYAELAEHKGMSAEQATGTASSYARKYALNGLFLIDETESDADSQKPSPKVEQPVIDIEGAKAKLIVVKTLNELKQVYTSLGKLEQANAEVIALKDKLKATLK